MAPTIRSGSGRAQSGPTGFGHLILRVGANSSCRESFTKYFYFSQVLFFFSRSTIYCIRSWDKSRYITAPCVKVEENYYIIYILPIISWVDIKTRTLNPPACIWVAANSFAPLNSFYSLHLYSRHIWQNDVFIVFLLFFIFSNVEI